MDSKNFGSGGGERKVLAVQLSTAAEAGSGRANRYPPCLGTVMMAHASLVSARRLAPAPPVSRGGHRAVSGDRGADRGGVRAGWAAPDGSAGRGLRAAGHGRVVGRGGAVGLLPHDRRGRPAGAVSVGGGERFPWVSVAGGRDARVGGWSAGQAGLCDRGDRCALAGRRGCGRAGADDCGGRMLIILDMDGTLITRFHGTATPRPYADVQLLPGVAVRVAALRQAGATLAVATNQGGVAFGYQTRAEVVTKLQRVAQALGYRRAIIADGTTVVARPASDTLLMLIAYGHPDADDPALRTPAQLARRKPGGGMLREACALFGAAPADAVYVGPPTAAHDGPLPACGRGAV